MTTLDKYLLKEISIPFAVGMALFFVVVAFGQVLKVSDSVTGLGISGAEIGQALLYSLPPLMGLLIPVSSLFSTLLGVGRLAADREVIGLCAAGVSPYRLLRVPVVVGLCLTLVAGFTVAFGEAWGIQGLRSLMARSAQRALAAGVRVGEFNEWVPGVTFFAHGQQGRRLTGVLFADLRDGERPVVISAQSGFVRRGSQPTDVVFELADGTILLTDNEADTQRVLRFETSHYRLDVGSLVGNKARTLSPVQEKSLAALWHESRTAEEASYRALLTIVLHRKAAIPLATLIFSMLAVPLACRSSPGARARGFLISSAIVGAYYYIGRAAELSARNGGFPPVLAAWLPDLLGILALAMMLYRFKRSAV